MKNDKKSIKLPAFFKSREMGIAIPTVLLMVIVTVVNPTFMDFTNVMSVLRTAAYTMLIGTTMTMVFITGGLDLSVGSVLALGGTITGLAITGGMNMWLSILLGVLAGGVIGLFNGFVIVKYDLPPMIVTLGTMNFARGLVQYLTRGTPVYPLPDEFNFLGQGYIFGGKVPVVIVVSIVLAILSHVVLTKTSFGRSIYATGGNRETARLSGINVKKTTVWVYFLTGMTAALAGIFTAARLGAAQSNAGTGMEMTIITAVVIGGTSTFGGSGTILGTVIGAILMSVISNGMVMMKISVYVQAMVLGLIVIGAVILDKYNRRRSGTD